MYAFPSGHNPKTGTQESGMTMRDYFAKDFSVALMQSFSVSHDDEFKLSICKQGYAWADAMLKARDEL